MTLGFVGLKIKCHALAHRVSNKRVALRIEVNTQSQTTVRQTD